MTSKRKLALAIGGSAGLFAVLTIIVARPGPPQFRFLEGAEFRYSTVSTEAGRSTCNESYFVNGLQAEVLTTVARELDRGIPQPELIAWEFGQGSTTVTVVDHNFGSTANPLTHVLIKRPARPGDIPRSWMSRMQSWF